MNKIFNQTLKAVIILLIIKLIKKKIQKYFKNKMALIF